MKFIIAKILSRKTTGWLLVISIGLFTAIYLALAGLLYITESSLMERLPAIDAVDATFQSPHKLRLIDNGAEALAARLALINSATQSIAIEYFIYELDLSSKIITHALIQKAAEGVKVRILVDFSLPVFKLAPSYALELQKAGIAVKYYNTASIARIFSTQHRTHRKILVADRKHAIVGGRNIANDYFDLSNHYNFLDSDLEISGDAVEAIARSFDLYWDAPLALSPEPEAAPKTTPDRIADFLEITKKEIEVKDRIMKFDDISPIHECNQSRFITDDPGVGVNMRRIFPALNETLMKAKSNVLAESPYFLLRSEGVASIEQLIKRGVNVAILTNSLRSTDAYYTVAPLFVALDRLSKVGFSLYSYKGDHLANYEGLPGGIDTTSSEVYKQHGGRWGVHAKRAVIDNSITIIGTYNIDPRSANFNSELIFICYDSESLASAMRASIQRRIDQSGEVLAPASKPNHENLIGDAKLKDILAMLGSIPLATTFDFLL